MEVVDCVAVVVAAAAAAADDADDADDADHVVAAVPRPTNWKAIPLDQRGGELGGVGPTWMLLVGKRKDRSDILSCNQFTYGTKSD